MAFATFGSIFVLSIVFPGECCSSGVKFQRNRWLTTYNWKDLHSTVQWQTLDANFKIVGGLYTQPDRETDAGGSMPKCLKKNVCVRIDKGHQSEKCLFPKWGLNIQISLWALAISFDGQKDKTKHHIDHFYMRWSLITTDYFSIKVGPRGVISIDNTSQPLWV